MKPATRCCVRRRGDCAAASEQATSWRGSAATSSSCCCRTSVNRRWPPRWRATCSSLSPSPSRSGARLHGQREHRHLLAPRRRPGRSGCAQERGHGDVPRQAVRQERLPLVRQRAERTVGRACGDRSCGCAARSSATNTSLFSMRVSTRLRARSWRSRRASVGRTPSSPRSRRRSYRLPPKRRACSCPSTSECCAQRARRVQVGETSARHMPVAVSVATGQVTDHAFVGEVR